MKTNKQFHNMPESPDSFWVYCFYKLQKLKSLTLTKPLTKLHKVQKFTRREIKFPCGYTFVSFVSSFTGQKDKNNS